MQGWPLSVFVLVSTFRQSHVYPPLAYIFRRFCPVLIREKLKEPVLPSVAPPPMPPGERRLPHARTITLPSLQSSWPAAPGWKFLFPRTVGGMLFGSALSSIDAWGWWLREARAQGNAGSSCAQGSKNFCCEHASDACGLNFLLTHYFRSMLRSRFRCRSPSEIHS